ncbi:MAG: DUF6603 domain-containing protein [Phormidium sp.]
MATTKPKLEEELEKIADENDDDKADDKADGKKGSSSKRKINIPIGPVQISFEYQKKSDKNNRNVIAYTEIAKDSKNLSLNVGDAIETMSTDIAKLLPKELKRQSIDFKRLIVIYSKDKTKKTSKWLFAFDLALADEFKFSNLPLVGDILQGQNGDAALVASLRIVATSQLFNLKEVRYFNALFPEDQEDLDKLPDPGEGKGKDEDIAIRKGFSLSGKFDFGEISHVLSLPVSAESDGGDIPAAPSKDATPASKNGIRFNIEKSIGVFTLQSIGFQYEEGRLALLFNAALKLSTFTLDCQNLGVRVPLKDKLNPLFNLDGIGVEYKSDNLHIAGALLRKKKEKNGIVYEEFLGLATFKLKLSGKGGLSFGISAIGSYANYNGQPALFFYAVLDIPLGGPGFFFVTGFALGLGYNRYLRVPSVDKLTEFPLVAQAVGGISKKNAKDTSELITQQLEELDQYVTLSPGSGFIAIGIKFTSYKMVDCFALLTIALGEDFEINLLGIATMKLPPIPTGENSKIPPVAEVTMLLRAKFSLNDGVIAIEAQLAASSYILSKDCFLTGGFAFYTWFNGPYAGDFVITLGGYHPDFKKPDHYPNVPRLGFIWKVDEVLFLKGEMYFALCSHALMAGGKLEASFVCGSLWAYFIAEAHFLISWQPYFYDIQIQVRMQAGLGILGPVCEGVKLHIWGPEFGGLATIKIVFVKVNIEFGDRSSSFPSPIDWETFKKSFLPDDKEVCTIAVTQGITRQLSQSDGTPLFVVNALEFELVTNSVIPTKQGYYLDGSEQSLSNSDAKTEFGVRSMGIKNDELETTHKIEITRDGIKVNQDQWKFEPATQQIPTGLWGDARVKMSQGKERLIPPETNEKLFLENTLSGFRIVPNKPPESGKTDSIKVSDLQYDTELINNVYAWQKIPSFAPVSAPDASRRTTIENNIVSTDTNTRRNQLLESLGFTPTEDVKLTNSVADAFVMAPQVK